jgi:lysophospholipase L1-like esterase
LVLLAGAELYLATRPPDLPYDPYDAFGTQYLNPFYFFSLPSDSKVLARINNPTVSVTPAGFRGSGPEQKGSRKLAFLVGGSAAFGHGASSDQTTICGYLNEIQGEYYFVNAGVPGWNSTQEFYRVAIQLLEYKPDVIVVYDGYNDVGINYKYHQDKMQFPPGTPDSYDDLAHEVDDIRARSQAPLIRVNFSRLYNLTFPRVRTRLSQALGQNNAGTKRVEALRPIDPETVDHDAASYLWNVENMTRLASARGTKVIVFWQAISMLHRIATAEERRELGEEGEQFQEYLQRFHRYVIENQDNDLQFFDLSNVFDRYPDKTRLTDLFKDKVHLTDRGNRILANEILSRISAPTVH